MWAWVWRGLKLAAISIGLSACAAGGERGVAALSSEWRMGPQDRVVAMVLPIDLGSLVAGGVVQSRPDWSQDANAHVSNALVERGTLRLVSLEEVMAGPMAQVVYLQDEVAQAIWDHSKGAYGGRGLPTKAMGFDWSLGPGSQALATQFEADYGLFVSGRGTYASGGRVAATMVAGALGLYLPLGQQELSAVLVELRTGKVLWLNRQRAGSQDDMREAEGAAALVEGLLKIGPLALPVEKDN